jgi:hypothetical protein
MEQQMRKPVTSLKNHVPPAKLQTQQTTPADPDGRVLPQVSRQNWLPTFPSQCTFQRAPGVIAACFERVLPHSQRAVSSQVEALQALAYFADRPALPRYVVFS